MPPGDRRNSGRNEYFATTGDRHRVDCQALSLTSGPLAWGATKWTVAE